MENLLEICIKIADLVIDFFSGNEYKKIFKKIK